MKLRFFIRPTLKFGFSCIRTDASVCPVFIPWCVDSCCYFCRADSFVVRCTASIVIGYMTAGMYRIIP